MKPKKQKQQGALIRREQNIMDYNSGNMGSLVLPEGVDKAEFLAAKLKKAEGEVVTLKHRIGGSTLVIN